MTEIEAWDQKNWKGTK